MKQVRLFIPKTDNAGMGLSIETRNIELEVLNVYGGFTRYEASGEWANEFGFIHKDEHTVIEVTMDEIGPALYRIKELVKHWCRQEAVYITSTEVEVLE